MKYLCEYDGRYILGTIDQIKEELLNYCHELFSFKESEHRIRIEMVDGNDNEIQEAYAQAYEDLSTSGHYVVVTQHDGVDHNNPLVTETPLHKTMLRDAKNKMVVMGNRYGNLRVARLEFVEV